MTIGNYIPEDFESQTGRYKAEHCINMKNNYCYVRRLWVDSPYIKYCSLCQFYEDMNANQKRKQKALS